MTAPHATTSPSQAAPTQVRILLLGGTSEAVALASALAARPRLSVISSLAGRVHQPHLPPGEVRVGGFGGLDGLVHYLQSHHIDLVVDATHPFATRISRNAQQACSHLALPLITLTRPPWTPTPEDRWREVPDTAAAASLTDRPGTTVFLSIGRQDLFPFASCTRAFYVIRAIDEPADPLPAQHRIILERGPFTLDHELALLRSLSIDLLVSKNSGGAATYAKIEAARLLQLPVLMIQRPGDPTNLSKSTVADVLQTLDTLLQKPEHQRSKT